MKFALALPNCHASLLLICTIALSFLSNQALGEDKFPEIYNTQKETIPFSSIETELASVRVPDGFRVQMFASEPEVQQPIGFTTDHKGRLWVAENYTYAESGVGFAKNLKDRIVILEDTDGDGVCDRRKVFWDQGDKLTSVLVGFGGVWALCAPKLLFIPDKDGDDVPDSEPVVVLDGWDDNRVGHNVVNGLCWGPDGWIYGRHGIQATSLVGKPGAAPSQRTALNCCIWRYHPTRGLFEVVAQGGTNPWGFDYDDTGQMFFINTVIGHLWHVVPGAFYKRMYGAHFEPYLYDLIDQCADHIHWASGERWQDAKNGMTDGTDIAGGGHAHCGLMAYLGDNWPERYRNTLFTVNLHGHRLNNDSIERNGTGYVGRHQPDFFFCKDPWFRGIELLYGPDGGVYLADWTDIGECHETDGVHRTSGRIFKITYGEPEKKTDLDLSRLSDLELVNLQLHPNDWYVRQSRRLLQERAADGKDMSESRGELLRLYQTQTDVTRRLRALWCLSVINAIDEQWLIGQLADPNEHIRVWAIRLLMDQGKPSPAIVEAFTHMAPSETSGLVRQFLASSLQKIDTSERWRIAEGLAGHAEDASDPVQPLMLWYGTMKAVPEHPKEALELARVTQVPYLRRNIARRITSDLETHPVVVESLVQLALGTDSPDSCLDILSGMNNALRGWVHAEPPPSWPKLSDRVTASEDSKAKDLIRAISVVFGEGRALEELKQVALDGTADPASRRKAIEILVSSHAEGMEPLLIKWLEDRSVATQAAKSLAAFNSPEAPAVLIARYRSLDPEYRTACLNTLSTKPAFALPLLEAVASGEIPREDLSAFHARQIRSFGDETLNRKLAEVWGEVRETAQAKKSLYDLFQNRLTKEVLAGADLEKGRDLFLKTCSSCHVLFGEGRLVGPDLTGGNRQNLAYLLENLVDPSATVPADFKMSIVTIVDGRVLNGVVLDSPGKTLVLKTKDEDLIIDREEIEKIRPSELSLMPDGLLDALPEDQVRDLIGYVMSSR
jgi:putative membrane-bound dehydrogenase-like protein